MTESERSRPIRDSVKFLGSFVRRPGQVGAVMPSSRYLADLLVGDLSMLEPGDVVVEYGPGTGPMTKVIDERLPDGVEYLGIELEEKFHSMLEDRYPHLRFVRGSAADVRSILTEHRLAMPKRIISGIPFASLPENVQQAIVLGTQEALHRDGEFRTFQYVHAYGLPAARRFRQAMSAAFGDFERTGPVVRNVPPAYALVYRH